jgi:uncharacterized membrane protein YphA (DoxX/SURF4 family)
VSQGGAHGRSLAWAAVVLEGLLALVTTLGALAFVSLAPHLSALGRGGGAEGDSSLGPLSLSGAGFSPVDAVSALLIGLAILFWIWVVLDLRLVVGPLERGELLDVESPALLLGILQTIAGGFLPGLLLIAASRSVRHAIGENPMLEVQRARRPEPPSELPYRRARALGRTAMVGFGVLWGIAGYSMFQNQFYLHLPNLIRTASQGAPGFLMGWFNFWAYASSLGGPGAASLAGSLQLALAVCLILGFVRKIAYFTGLLAAVFLWVVPEAFGGPFTGGAFSLGPGVVYAIGMVALIGLNATYGPDRYTIDRLIEARFPDWARLAEVREGLLPAIGRWYARNAARLTRAAETALGVVFAASSVLALHYRLDATLPGLLAARAGPGQPAGLAAWFSLWDAAGPAGASALAVALSLAELAIASLVILGLARKSAGFLALGTTLLLWSVVEAFGGTPGPGYTDPGVGIAEACAVIAVLAIVAARGSDMATLDRWAADRFPRWSSWARFSEDAPERGRPAPEST